MVLAAFVALAALTLSPAAPPAGHHHSHRSETRCGKFAGNAANSGRGADGPRAFRETPVADPNALYSQRARKRMAMYLKLRLLELRELHLERAAAAIERRLPLSELLKGP
ncbi:MAG: hypothetical protein M3R44_00005 [Candidatus Eremiobacteraeota bacterium]|nr:hypothetical protein [Candidatus Eremiobacteraeota bacterium]